MREKQKGLLINSSILILGTASMILSRIYEDFIYFFFISIVCVFIYLLSFRFKFKYFFKALSIFLFLHLIIFPSIYLALLNINPNSFEFDKNIFKNERETSILSINNKYKPKILKTKINILSSLLKENSKSLDSTLEYLNQGNLINAENFILGKDCLDIFSRERPPTTSAVLKVNDIMGKQVVTINQSPEGCTFSDSERTIRLFIEEQKTLLQSKTTDFENNFKEITKDGKFWTYRQILAYSINIFLTGNMIPISRIANVIYFLHQLIVFTFLLSLIISQIPLMKNQNSENK